jgi:hypothetical protein
MKITMAAIVAIPVSLVVSSTLTFALEPKRDLLGFRPGMSYTEAASLAATVCKNKLGPPPWGNGNTPSTFFLTCSLGTRPVIGVLANDLDENLVFMFGNALPQQSLISMSYHFAKPQPDTDLYRYVVERFGVPVSCLSTHVCLLNAPGLYLSFAEGKTISTGFLFLIDRLLSRKNEERWKQEHSPPKFEANGEERKNLENSIVTFPPVAASMSSPNDIRKRYWGPSADRETPGANFRDSATGVPVIVREERR